MDGADDFHRRYSPRTLYTNGGRSRRWWQVYVNKRRRARLGEFVEVLNNGKVVDFGVVDSVGKPDWVRLGDPTTVTIMEFSLA